MSRALAVAGREFKASLTSPLGYVFLLLFVLATLLVFFFFEGFSQWVLSTIILNFST